MELKGKRFLITHIWLRGYSGAEINILELAKYLKSKGGQVTIFTYSLLGVMKDEFSRESIPVITDFQHKFMLSDFDFIFSAQNILPNSLIDDLTRPHKHYPKFFFFHMAALADHVLEQPYINGLEEKLGSVILPISEEIIQNNLSRFNFKRDNLVLYPNPAPISFTEYSSKGEPPKLKKILVVSNHPPKEIKEMKSLFNEQSITVDYMGIWTDNYRLSTVEIFANYDCIVGIGKNAQYSLSMGVPIFVYDHFSGPGFLNESNFDETAWFNFSGRNKQDRRTAIELVDEIIKGFEMAWKFQNSRVEEFKILYSFDTVINNLMIQANRNNKEIQLFPSEYASYVKAMNLLVKNQIVNPNNDVINLWDAVHQKDSQIDTLQGLVSETNRIVANQSQKVDKLENELKLIKASKSYRFFEYLRKVRIRLGLM